MADFTSLNVTEQSVTSNDSAFAEYLKETNLQGVDLTRGGQWGLLPMIGNVVDGKYIHEWMYNQAYIRRDVIPVVLQVPRIFDLFPNSDYWKKSAKALFEVHARTIEGLNSSLSVETVETELGLSGAKLKEVSNVTRAETNVTITVDEKYGTPIEKFLDVVYRYGLMDPDKKAPLIASLPGAETIDVYTPEWYTWTVLFIEPDVLQTKVEHAFLVSNMFPTSELEIIGKKDKHAAKEKVERTIEFGGFSLPHTNKNVMELATTILNELKLYNRTPDEIYVPVKDVDAALRGRSGDIYYERTAYTEEGNDQSIYESGDA